MAMKFKNTTDHVIILDALGLPPVAPKGTVDVPEELCAPSRTDGGQRAKSALECVAPQLEPVDPEDKKVWLDLPPLPEPRSRVVTIAKRAPEEAPGVKALRDLRAKQQEAAVAAAKVEVKK